MVNTTEAKWRRLISAQEKSGLSVREFAESRGIPVTTLYWRRSQARRKSMDLVPVEIQGSMVDGRSPSSFELCLGDSMTLRIPSGFDEDELRRLVRALQC